jgi:hypothetical protein
MTGKPLHRHYRGKMLYLTDGVGEMGREFFSVTVQPNGERTLRAQCEMDDDRLLRDVVLTVGMNWAPKDAFLRLTIDGQTLGSSWFRFDAREAECEGITRLEGRISQHFRVTQDIESFGTHALHGDAWVVGRLREWHGKPEDFSLATFASSQLPNGASGPLLMPCGPGFSRIHDLGDVELEVPAGRFTCRHIRIDVPGVDDFEVWAGGADCLPVRLRSDKLRQTYELVELDGDWC